MRTSGTSKHEFSSLFVLVDNFCPSGSGPRATKINADPCKSVSATMAKSNVKYLIKNLTKLVATKLTIYCSRLSVRGIQNTEASSYKHDTTYRHSHQRRTSGRFPSWGRNGTSPPGPGKAQPSSPADRCHPEQINARCCISGFIWITGSGFFF